MKDETIPPGNLELIFYRQKSENPCRRSNTKKKESSTPAPKAKSSVPLRIAGKTTPKPAASGREHVR